MEFKLHKSLNSYTKHSQGKNKEDIFLSPSFLSVFFNNHKKNIQHLFLEFKDKSSKGFIYAQKIKIGGKQISSYQFKNNIKKQTNSLLLNLFNFNIIGFGNNFLTNEASISIEGEVSNPKDLIHQLVQFTNKYHRVSNFIFPDHFFKEFKIDHPEKIYPKLIVLQVDEEMNLEIRSNWNSFDDYINSLKKKYKKKLKQSFLMSSDLHFKKFGEKEIRFHENKMQILFDSVRSSSSFYSTPFNVKSYIDFIKIKDLNCIVYGCFIKDELVGFCSEWIIKKKLYSYFIGLDYNLNKKYRIYERILYKAIEDGINEKVENIILGRTAAEFKSNFGAVPKNSLIYIYVKNPLLRLIVRPIFSLIKPKKWIQRNPFLKL